MATQLVEVVLLTTRAVTWIRSPALKLIGTIALPLVLVFVAESEVVFFCQLVAVQVVVVGVTNAWPFKAPVVPVVKSSE
jgi:hypothetical protein